MAALLCGVFFFSGASALVFETLFFHGAGLTLGNSIWTSSIIMSAFMAGLAIGSVAAARLGDRTLRPLKVYAALEAAVALSSVALVVAFPRLPSTIAPLLSPLAGAPLALDVARFVAAFAAVVVPATAMGATLPTLVRALSTAEGDYGRLVGRLYGWNTLGAMLGAVAGEAVLVARLGVRGAAAAAAIVDGALALVALAVAGRLPSAPPQREESPPLGEPAWVLLGTGFLTGAMLLALEVVWFRFLLLFAFATSMAFAILLGVVLLGIGLGSLAAGALLRVEPGAHARLPAVAAMAGLATALTYACFPGVPRQVELGFFYDLPGTAWAAARLMLPTCFFSGVLFALLAKRLREEVRGDARAAALLTLANTLGATTGSLAGAFVLLAFLGVEGSLLGITCGYGAVAALLYLGLTASQRRRRAFLLPNVAAGAAVLVQILFFPLGLMKNELIPLIAARWPEGATLVAVKEEAAETLMYTRKALWGEPVFHRLIVNGYSMSGSMYGSRRYMNLFVYLPLALHPAPRTALVICYGVGSTAKAVTDTGELREIHIVDTSKDILSMGRMVFPPPEGYPLDDPRVKAHVEDGRFFLMTTQRRFDLITGEPPPPKVAGVGSLYSREYFKLVRDRLSEGGFASYWLPVYQLELPETKAVVRAFCDAFEDCSLWTGWGYEWILLGSRGAQGPGSLERFSRQWKDPRVLPTLLELGIETPEQIGSSFLADNLDLHALTEGVLPLDDDHPSRLSARRVATFDSFYGRFMESGSARDRFERSAFIKHLWPEKLRLSTLGAFESQEWIDDVARRFYGAPAGLEVLSDVLTKTTLKAPVYWLLLSSAREQRIATFAASRGMKGALLEDFLGAQGMADRDYPAASDHFSRALEEGPDAERILKDRALALCLAGREGEASTVLKGALQRAAAEDSTDLRWLAEKCATTSSTATRR